MYWLLKTEPADYAFSDLVRDGATAWTGVKNFQAIGNLKKIQEGDELFIYHTGKEKAVIGVAQALSPAYTHNNGDTVIDLKAVYPLKRAVTLAEIKADSRFSEWELVRLPRLSVMPVTGEHWQLVHELASQ